MAVDVKLETITPERAEQLLARNVHNRNVRYRQVETLAGAIKRGEWVVNGDMIRLDQNGHLIDGQHRVMAVLEADMPIQTFVGYGFESGAQETMDQGRARTLGDVLKLRGESQYSLMAAAIRKVWAYEQYGVPTVLSSWRSPTVAECVDCLERHEGLRTTVATAVGGSRRSTNPIRRAFKLIDSSAVVALLYLMSLANGEDAEFFWQRVGDGQGLLESDPMYVLRERLIREADEPGGGVHPKVKMVFAVRAWNAYREGETIKRLVFMVGGHRPDKFPGISGCPVVPDFEVVGSRIQKREAIAL